MGTNGRGDWIKGRYALAWAWAWALGRELPNKQVFAIKGDSDLADGRGPYCAKLSGLPLLEISNRYAF